MAFKINSVDMGFGDTSGAVSSGTTSGSGEFSNHDGMDVSIVDGKLKIDLPLNLYNCDNLGTDASNCPYNCQCQCNCNCGNCANCAVCWTDCNCRC